MDPKSWYFSRTIWVNVLTVAVSIGTQFADVVPPTVAAKLLGFVGVLNIVLRFITTQPVSK